MRGLATRFEVDRVPSHRLQRPRLGPAAPGRAGAAGVRGAGRPTTCYSPVVDAQFLTIIGIVLAVGFGLAGLMIRTMARLDRHID